MWEFFRGWRRKAGILTLVMACLFMAGWIRSIETQDQFVLCYDPPDYFRFISYHGSLIWKRHYDMSSVQRVFPRFEQRSWSYATNKTADIDSPYAIDFQGMITQSKSESYGFVFTSVIIPDHKISLWAAPYWSIVLPLTLLSAFLLLTKPLPSTQKKTSEPIPNEGGAAS